MTFPIVSAKSPAGPYFDSPSKAFCLKAVLSSPFPFPFPDLPYPA